MAVVTAGLNEKPPEVLPPKAGTSELTEPIEVELKDEAELFAGPNNVETLLVVVDENDDDFVASELVLTAKNGVAVPLLFSDVGNLNELLDGLKVGIVAELALEVGPLNIGAFVVEVCPN